MEAIRTILVWLAAISLGSFSWHAGRVVAQQPTDLATTALALAPQDAAFFATSVNLRRSWQEFVQGSFVSSLRRVDYVRELERELISQWENPQGPALQVRAAWDNPNIRSLLQLGGDMFSQEVFVYGGGDWVQMIDGLVDFQTRMLAALREDPEAIGEFLDQLQQQDVDAIRIPTTVIGFRLADDVNARMQLDQLEGLLRVIARQDERVRPFVQRLTRRDTQDGQMLTLSLDTSLIPLEQMDLDDEQRAKATRLIELLQGRSLSVMLGVKANILLIAVGEQPDLLAGMGQSGNRLLDHEALQVLQDAEVGELRSVNFVSRQWRESQWRANFGNYFRNLTAQFSVVLEQDSDEIPDAQQWQAEIARDAEWLDAKINALAPQFGDMLAWSHAIPAGLQGWVYDWNRGSWLTNAAPLQVLQHAGESPVFLVGWKHTVPPQMAELWDYLLERLPEHARRFIAAAEQDDDERERVMKIFDRAWPLAEEAVAIYRQQIAPALADRETLVALSTAWTTSQLGPALPPADDPLVLPELAVACGVADREQFVAGCRAMYDLLDRVVELVRDVNPQAVPAGYRVPRPAQQEVAGGTSYYYQELVDAVDREGFKPQVLLSDTTVIFGYSDRQVQDMLEATPLRRRPAWMTDEFPVAAVSYVDYAGLAAAARPWLLYGLSLSGMPLDQPLGEAPLPVPSANDLLEMWDCFASAGIATGTVTVEQDGPRIARWVWVGR